jgi:hypothetical protein
MNFDEHLRDRTCTFCSGEGGYWEQGPNTSVTCTQCSTNWNRAVGFKYGCICTQCDEARNNDAAPSYVGLKVPDDRK